MPDGRDDKPRTKSNQAGGGSRAPYKPRGYRGGTQSRDGNRDSYQSRSGSRSQQRGSNPGGAFSRYSDRNSVRVIDRNGQRQDRPSNVKPSVEPAGRPIYGKRPPASSRAIEPRQRREPFVPRESRPPREQYPSRESRPPREQYPPRESRPPREQYPPRESRPPREQYPPRESRPPREQYPPRESRPPREQYPPRESRPPREQYPSRESRPPREQRPPREPRRVEPSALLESESTPNAANILAGRNPIREALRAGRDLEKLMAAKGDLSGSAREIVAMARERGVPVHEVDRAALERLSPAHQGLVAIASAYKYSSVEDILARAAERGEEPLVIILDGVTDPHNLGAIIRSAECAGAHGVIIPDRRAAGLTASAVKASAGAVEHLPVARVVNISRTLAELKEQGLWILAAHTGGEDYAAADLSGPVALVIGSEGEGVSRLVLEKSDKRVALPIRGRTESLNASVAAGILLYEVTRRRGV